jgi:hypothetical protein
LNTNSHDDLLRQILSKFDRLSDAVLTQQNEMATLKEQLILKRKVPDFNSPSSRSNQSISSYPSTPITLSQKLELFARERNNNSNEKSIGLGTPAGTYTPIIHKHKKIKYNNHPHSNTNTPSVSIGSDIDDGSYKSFENDEQNDSKRELQRTIRSQYTELEENDKFKLNQPGQSKHNKVVLYSFKNKKTIIHNYLISVL